jgi:amino acid adenylation domain-containing protein/non-ribosomal peptide synthase protein (TIGR01720 family)
VIHVDEISNASNLTRGQFLIYMGQQLAPNTPLYNMAIAFTIEGDLDVDRFCKAFQRCINECDAMRTSFTTVDGVPQQISHDFLEAQVDLIDLTDQPDPAEAARIWSENRCRKILDLGSCLFDSALLKIGHNKHTWFFNQHHLITDAWSTGVFFQRLSHQYGHQFFPGERGQESGLSSFSSYQDFERTSRAGLSEKTQRHWNERRENASEPPRLYGAPRRHDSTASTRLTRKLDREMSRRLRQLALRKEWRSLTYHLSSFNVFTTLLLAWQSRVSGQRKIEVGTLAHNRPTRIFRETVGPFVELFPLSVALDVGETFASLIGKTREEANKFIQHALPGASQPEIQRGFNVVLNYITASFGSFANFPTTCDWVHCGHGDIGHHLRLQVHDFDDSGEVVLHFDFNEAVFNPNQRNFAIDHFLRLLEAFLENPNQPIEAVSLPGKAEREWLLETFNQSTFPLADHATVVHRFSEQAGRNPESTALRCGNRTVSYAELEARSNGLAKKLQQAGVVRGDLVALLIPRSPEAIISILGVLKIAGAYLPLDPTFPERRVHLILKDSSARVLLTSSPLAEDPGIPVLDPSDSEADEEWEQELPQPSDAAYVIYTSGSTGKPKGVIIEHAALLNYAAWAESQYCQGQQFAFPLFTPLTFDLTVTSIFVPLISGGEIVIYRESTERGDLTLFDVLEDNLVDIIKLTPSHLALLRGRNLSDSRVSGLILGGEDLKFDIAQATLDTFGGDLTIYNEYGPTETTVGCMIHAFDPDQDSRPSVPIGIPAGNAQIYLLNEAMSPVPRGVTGEIHVGGRGLARGYLNQPELTAQRFLENPFIHGQRIYRTGDLARINPRGLVEYLGRTDDQVKFRGVRIELGEIEVALSSITGIKSASVKLLRGQHNNDLDSIQYCATCGLSSNYPGASFDEKGVCHLCHGFKNYRQKTRAYFRNLKDLTKKIETSRNPDSDYDCMMLLSGGKDSTYALCRLVDLGFKVYAFTLDNGYISEEAKANISRVVEALGVDHAFATTPAMNEIFVDSLKRFSNVCNGCFKTVYTMAMKQAREMKLPFIITGLSRGQFFETRLTEELFQADEIDSDNIDQTILQARKAYHRIDDAVNRLLDGSCFQNDAIFEEVQFLDFYRYCDVSLEEMLSYLENKAPWIRPSDTGRSTNCLINDAGIYVHKKERGFHNYAFPYSWDVRMGHKTRDAALAELNDKIDEAGVHRMLNEVGYSLKNNDLAEETSERLVAYFVGSSDIDGATLRQKLSRLLPGNMVPSYFVQLDEMPLTSNGKLNSDALPAPRDPVTQSETEYTAPRGEAEALLTEIWQRILRLNRVGTHDNFFDLGGDSIMAIQIVARANEAGLGLTPGLLFSHPTISELAPLGQLSATFTAEQGPVTGAYSLSQTQRWFFDQDLSQPDYWNQALSLRLANTVTIDQLNEALKKLQQHHDILRSRFIKGKDGWSAEIRELSGELNIIQSSQADREQLTSKLHSSLDLSSGKLISGALFPTDDGHQTLLLILHHLVVDAVSWPILLSDLSTLLSNRQIPRKTTSYIHWTNGQVEAARAIDEKSVAYWLNLPSFEMNIPDRRAVEKNEEAYSETLSVHLSPEATESLIHEFPKQRHVQPHALLLAALAETLHQWTGDHRVGIELEGHGREELVSDADLTRTVGWFTSFFPLWLDLSEANELEGLPASVKTSLRGLPHRGASHSLLRYFHPDETIRNRLSGTPQPQVLFNYLGLADQLIPEDSIFSMEQPLSLHRGPQNTRSREIEINATIVDDSLRVDWSYHREQYEPETIKFQATQYLTILRKLLKSDSTQPSAEDFPQADLDQNQLDKLMSALKKLD